MAQIDRSAVATALAKAIAYKNCGNDTAANDWASRLVGLLECHSILGVNPGRLTRAASAQPNDPAMTLEQFSDALKTECAKYGHVFTPLTDAQIRIVRAGGFTVDQAYGIACDVANGFSFDTSLRAS